jgi:NADPH-dependent 2,4-dienoyl-CoA reductase/sulfur reductase-like enzyme
MILGGSHAGISAALRTRQVNPGFEVSVVVAERDSNDSICDLLFWLREMPDRTGPAHRTAKEIERQGMHLLLKRAARSICDG